MAREHRGHARGDRNGYFIHPALTVLRDLTESGLIPLVGADAGTGTLFATDGGGSHFAIAADGTVHRSEVASRDSDFHLVATDLQDFLDRIRRAIIHFAESGDPGTL